MTSFRRSPVLTALAVAVALAAGAAPLGAQETPAAEPAPRPAEPTPAELAAGARSTQDSAAIALQEIERLGEVDGLRASIAAAQVRQRELAGMLEALRPLEHTRPERLFRLRNEALAHQARLDGIAERLSERVGALGTLRGAWRERQETWSAWRAEARERPELAAQLPEIERTVERIEPVLARSDRVAPELAALGETAERLRAGTRELLEETAALRAGRREALLRADQPLLLSREHRAAVRDPGAWRPGEAVRPGALAAFAREHSLLLVVHLLLALLLGLLALRLRRHTVPEGEWSGMLRHPWAVAVFAATAFLARRYILAPPLWDVVSWSLLAGAGAVLAGTLLRGRALRLMIASVAVVYPLVLLAEALHVPSPVFRLALAAAAAAAVIGFPVLAAQADPAKSAGRRARWVLGVATGLSAAVLITQVLGFDQLSRWLVHATLTSAYVAFSIAFLLVVARGALRTLLRKEFVGRARMVGAVAVPLVERVVAVLQVVLVVAGALVLLDVWELAPSPIETWGRVVGWGFTVAGLQVTVGRILFAAVLVYLAATASWLARTIVSTRVTHGWGVERGVAESINALVHYAVITLGILLALGALGMELQNFAIVAGALGVGIGFGLQNVVNNFVSGLILLFERPVRVGDTVEIGEEWGTIKKIGLRSTVVVTFSQSELIVPNGDLVSEKVTNWTLSNPVTRLAIPVGVAYGSDVQKVLRILIEAAPAHPAVVEEPAPMALFTGFGDSSLDFELRIWVREIAARLPAKSAVLAEIDRRFREEGLEIPFPQRDLHLRTVDAKAAAAIAPPAAPADGGRDDG
jgi:potassium-dependent mechanosensitive channel